MKALVLLLVLSSVLCVSADVQHESNAISGCSDTDGEDVVILDDEAVWYADFYRKIGVDTLPDFADPMRSPVQYDEAVANREICRYRLQIIRQAMKDVPKELDPPSNLIIYTELNEELRVKNTLICYVTGFYPAPVNVSWTKNGESVIEGTSISVAFPNTDGTFRQTARLDFVPQPGDSYTCTVEHVALTRPIMKFHDVEIPKPSIGPVIFCGAGLTVGVLGAAAGTYLLIRGNK
ncbi:HLA class II histocompatibility antigen, DP alpha 1 chain-like [Archocentrus centrarchus]|uniref:HLA class II histocompatibility antigen, DP alpha 1 chain-like n=1 Tax=Archocentrus centrarchus TaxID=63155 RepID=UPI0011E9D8D7|nr:HLA class II histocompatibility antigen, DP alpha 1 chain-like [Archocentrus centrarchus]